VTREFFATWTVGELEGQSDHWLEDQGRLTEPMRYDPATDKYVPVTWDEAFALIGRELRALADPNEAEFYTSGRTSNEAAFLYQLFARLYGTNNFPDCSNMCHEPTSVGLPESIGIGKGTVVLEDFAHADAIFILGQNPGTNSPRMMTELHNASRRGAPIIVFNPLRERALERFAAPQDPIEMATFGSTRIASEYCQVRVGGDAAALKGSSSWCSRRTTPRGPQASRQCSIRRSSRSTPTGSSHSLPISGRPPGTTSSRPAGCRASNWNGLPGSTCRARR
jgi:formate dehydrogenase major subunit